MTDDQGVIIQIPGFTSQAFDCHFLPNVGEQVIIDKHLTDGGLTMLVEVVNRKWVLNQGIPGETSPFFSITLETKRIEPS